MKGGISSTPFMETNLKLTHFVLTDRYARRPEGMAEQQHRNRRWQQDRDTRHSTRWRRR